MYGLLKYFREEHNIYTDEVVLRSFRAILRKGFGKSNRRIEKKRLKKFVPLYWRFVFAKEGASQLAVAEMRMTKRQKEKRYRKALEVYRRMESNGE